MTMLEMGNKGSYYFVLSWLAIVSGRCLVTRGTVGFYVHVFGMC